VVEGITYYTAGEATPDNNISWHAFGAMSGASEPEWDLAPGGETADTPGSVPVTGSGGTILIPLGFGVIWVESGLDPAESKVADHTCEWTRIDTLPLTASVWPVGQVGEPAPEPLTLILRQLNSAVVDDAAGRCEYEGGQLFTGSERVGDYALTRRVVIAGVDVQNVAILAVTLFLAPRPPWAAEHMTLQGSHDFGSGVGVGSVSASSSRWASRIGHQFQRTGDTLIVQ
jgi:hypothetical protein